MKSKLISVFIAIIAAALVGFGGIYVHQQRQFVMLRKNDNSVGLKIAKSKVARGNIPDLDSNKTVNTNQKEGYSTDDWMLMGYMAYAHDNYVESRHIHNNAELVADVGDDLASGVLEATKAANNTYHLTNKFGNVDVEVEDEDVKIIGDGTTVMAKSKLKDTFKAYAGQINKMVTDISSDSNGNDTLKDSRNTSTKSKTSDTSSKTDNTFSDNEIAVACWLRSEIDDPAPAALNQISRDLSKFKQMSVDEIVKKDADDFAYGPFKSGTDTMDFLVIEENVDTSRNKAYHIDNSDKILEFYDDGNKHETISLSKAQILKTWTPYKADIDKILNELEYNNSRSLAIYKAQQKLN